MTTRSSPCSSVFALPVARASSFPLYVRCHNGCWRNHLARCMSDGTSLELPIVLDCLLTSPVQKDPYYCPRAFEKKPIKLIRSQTADQCALKPSCHLR